MAGLSAGASGAAAPALPSASAAEHPDVVHAKVDTEAEPGLAGAANINSIPTLMAFREGILVFNQPGALPPAALEQVIDAVKALDMVAIRAQLAEQAAAHGDADHAGHDHAGAQAHGQTAGVADRAPR